MPDGNAFAIGFAHRLRRLPDWILHSWRLRAACAALGNRPRPESVLVICHGNICRSPFAAAVIAQALPEIRVSSAGFMGPGRPAPDEAIAAAARCNIDLSSHRSSIVTPELVYGAAVIITMDAMQRREIHDRFGRLQRDLFVLGDFDPESTERRAIRDPVTEPLPVFQEVYARIVRCVEVLERVVRRARRAQLERASYPDF